MHPPTKKTIFNLQSHHPSPSPPPRREMTAAGNNHPPSRRHRLLLLEILPSQPGHHQINSQKMSLLCCLHLLRGFLMPHCSWIHLSYLSLLVQITPHELLLPWLKMHHAREKQMGQVPQTSEVKSQEAIYLTRRIFQILVAVSWFRHSFVEGAMSWQKISASSLSEEILKESLSLGGGGAFLHHAIYDCVAFFCDVCLLKNWQQMPFSGGINSALIVDRHHPSFSSIFSCYQGSKLPVQICSCNSRVRLSTSKSPPSPTNKPAIEA